MFSARVCRGQAHCYLYISFNRGRLSASHRRSYMSCQRAGMFCRGAGPVGLFLSGSRSVLRLLLQAPFPLADFWQDPWRQRCPLSVATPFRWPRVELIEMEAWSIWLMGGEKTEEQNQQFFPDKEWRETMGGFQRGVFHPSRPPLAGTPPWHQTTNQWDCYHVPMIHKVRRGNRWMLTRTKFFCRMPGDGKQLLVLLTCSGAMIVAMSNTFRLDSVFFRRTLDRPSCNEQDVIKFERVRAVSRLPCHNTKAPPIRLRQ